MENAVLGILLTLLLAGTLTLASNFRSVKAFEMIYIMPDGSIFPSTAPINRNGDIYRFTGDILGQILVMKSDIIIDGRGYTLQGNDLAFGFQLSEVGGITITNTEIENFLGGIYLYGSSHNTISRNEIRNNSRGIELHGFSDNNIIYENDITNNPTSIWLCWASSNNIYHNNVVGGSVESENYPNILDDGYPSGGNYWSDYDGADVKQGPGQDQPGSDGIGDTPYIVDARNRDRYPLMNPYGSAPPPNYALTITATSGGTTDPTPGAYEYSEGQIVPVQAVPSLGYRLDHWELDGANVGTTNPQDVTMDTSHLLHAVFIWVGTHNLTITTTIGGTTIPSPGTYTYTKGDTVGITAFSDAGYVLDYWELDGDNVGADNPLNVTMNADHALRPFFTPTYTLTITATTGGTTDPTPGSYTHVAGTQVTVTALPEEGYDFEYWELEGVPNSTNPISLTMNNDYALNAVFARITYTLTVTATTGGFTDPSPGTYSYPSGTTVSISASPDTEYYLDRWELDNINIGIPNPVKVMMNMNHTLHATFKQLSPGHDIAIKSVTSKTVVGQGFLLTIKVTVINIGSYTETFNVTIYTNNSEIDTINDITLLSGNSTTVTFTWNTTSAVKGNYNMSAYAWPVPDETEIEDNKLVDIWIRVTIPGDVDGNGWVEIKDILAIALGYGGSPDDPDYEPNLDVNCDEFIDIKDILTAAINYGQHYP